MPSNNNPASDQDFRDSMMHGQHDIEESKLEDGEFSDAVLEDTGTAHRSSEDDLRNMVRELNEDGDRATVYATQAQYREMMKEAGDTGDVDSMLPADDPDASSFNSAEDEYEDDEFGDDEAEGVEAEIPEDRLTETELAADEKYRNSKRYKHDLADSDGNTPMTVGEQRATERWQQFADAEESDTDLLDAETRRETAIDTVAEGLAASAAADAEHDRETMRDNSRESDAAEQEAERRRRKAIRNWEGLG